MLKSIRNNVYHLNEAMRIIIQQRQHRTCSTDVTIHIYKTMSISFVRLKRLCGIMHCYRSSLYNNEYDGKLMSKVLTCEIAIIKA